MILLPGSLLAPGFARRDNKDMILSLRGPFMARGNLLRLYAGEGDPHVASLLGMTWKKESL